MRSWLFPSIYPALLVILALLFLGHTSRAQTVNGDEPFVGESNPSLTHELGLHEFGLHELGLHALRAREIEALARHQAEMQALERAAIALRARNDDAAFGFGSDRSLAWPDGALGVIHINRPREMMLLHLRGLAGSGTALLRLDDSCVSVPLRFVAGDFGGDRITARRAPPVRIAVQSQEALDAILRGDDLVSGMYEVASLTGTGPNTDLILLDGLTIEHGFVINPGRSIIDDIFGVQGLYVPCEL